MSECSVYLELDSNDNDYVVIYSFISDGSINDYNRYFLWFEHSSYSYGTFTSPCEDCHAYFNVRIRPPDACTVQGPLIVTL